MRNPAQLGFEEQAGGEVGAMNAGSACLGGVAGVGGSPAAGLTGTTASGD